MNTMPLWSDKCAEFTQNINSTVGIASLVDEIHFNVNVKQACMYFLGETTPHKPTFYYINPFVQYLI